eukprot:scaffold3287_cov274-Chaetoceros_neogracile.AAC.4
MGPGVLNNDHIAEFFAHRLRTGLTIKAFGDGTVKDDIGAHGWHIRPDLNLTYDLTSKESAAQTDGHQDTISSLRTERAAILAALYLIRAICNFYDVRTSPSYIQYHLDNKEALSRLNITDDASVFDTANPITTDYDIWAAIRDATSSTPGIYFGTHVKGYQDENNPIDSLSPEAQMNIRMDKIAGDCRIAHPSPLPAKAHSGHQVSLTRNKHIVMTKIHLQLRSALTAPSLQDFIQRKENWDEHIVSMIDWQAHGS